MRKIFVFGYLNPVDFVIKIGLVIEADNNVIFEHNEIYEENKLSAGRVQYVKNILREKAMLELSTEEQEHVLKPDESKCRYYQNKFIRKEN